jgi:hypothetical protein
LAVGGVGGGKIDTHSKFLLKYSRIIKKAHLNLSAQLNTQCQCTMSSDAAALPAGMELVLDGTSSDDGGDLQPQSNSKRSRDTANTSMYDHFTDDGVPAPTTTTNGIAYLLCKACIKYNTSQKTANESLPITRKKIIVAPTKVRRVLRDSQENVKYFLNKRYVRKDKLSLERFMVLANITSTNTDDHDIEFPELYEIYK